MITYIPVNIYNYTIILGIFVTCKEAEDAYIQYLTNHNTFDKFYSAMEKEFKVYFKCKFDVTKLKHILFLDDTFDDTTYDNYSKLNQYASNVHYIGVNIHEISDESQRDDVISMIISYDGWSDIDGRNQLEHLLSYKFGYSESHYVDLKKLAKTHPLF
jgi:hypothetical protein